jgi:hypothetical protein
MNIRNILVAAGSALAISALATAASAATVSATANASVTVISPTTMGTNDIVGIGGGGNGSIVASTTSAAKFTLASQGAITYSLAPTLTFVQTGLTNITVGTPTVSSGTLGTLGANGSQDIKYGASFDMGVATVAQAYTGTLTVIVTYN